jgi:methionyl-tRNA formyltransferase
MRIALATAGAKEFAALQTACVNAGHQPVVYAYCRSLRPRGQTDDHALGAIGSVVRAAPPGMDLLLPGTGEGLAESLAGYRPDLLVVHGFNWKLPAAVLEVPRLGAINIHASLLPKYRGPAPVLQAIRNGDEKIGMTVHRMDERFDTGPILAQQGGIALEDAVTPAGLWKQTRPVLIEVLSSALKQVANRAPGTPQDETAASYAGFIEPAFRIIDWTRSARDIHNQVRMFAFIGRKSAPLADIGNGRIRVFRTRLEPGPGLRISCADAPIWITDSSPVALGQGQ